MSFKEFIDLWEGWTWRELFPKDEPIGVSVFMVFFGVFILCSLTLVLPVHFLLKLFGIKGGIFEGLSK